MHAEDFTYKERVLRVSLTEIRVFFNLKWSGFTCNDGLSNKNSMKFSIYLPMFISE
jgi:hypothetical protein